MKKFVKITNIYHDVLADSGCFPAVMKLVTPLLIKHGLYFEDLKKHSINN